MPIKCEEYSQVCVLAQEGDLGGDQIALVRKAFEERIDQHHIVDFVLDLEKCGFIDSDGLELLLWMRRKTEELFGQIKLASLDENVKKILEITRLGQKFECHTDLPSALKAMG